MILILRWVLFALCVMLTAWIIPGIFVENFQSALLIAFIIGLIPLRAGHHRGHHLGDGTGPERTVGRGSGLHCGADYHRIHRPAAGTVDPGPSGHQAGTVMGGGTYGCLYRVSERCQEV